MIYAPCRRSAETFKLVIKSHRERGRERERERERALNSRQCTSCARIIKPWAAGGRAAAAGVHLGAGRLAGRRLMGLGCPVAVAGKEDQASSSSSSVGVKELIVEEGADDDDGA